MQKKLETITLETETKNALRVAKTQISNRRGRKISWDELIRILIKKANTGGA